MDCKKARKSIILDYYGELEPAEKPLLEEHLRTCAECAAELVETKRVFALVDAAAPAEDRLSDPERAWRGIQDGIRPGRGKERGRLALGLRWGFAATAFGLVLAAGIFIGRTWFQPRGLSRSTAPQTTAAGRSPGSALGLYLENVKPILIDYANEAPETSGHRQIVVDASVIHDLILENILLKRSLAGKDPAAAELLDDLDLILKEIFHQERPDAASPGAIRDLIRQRDVLFKMNIFKTL